MGAAPSMQTRLALAGLGMACLLPCFLILLRFRLYNLQSERFLCSLLICSFVFNIAVVVDSLDDLLDSFLFSFGKDVNCLKFSFFFTFLFMCSVFEGFFVVYSYHMARCGRHFPWSKERLVHTFLWLLGVAFFASFQIGCHFDPSDNLCTTARGVILCVYCAGCLVFLGVYGCMLVEIHRRMEEPVGGESDSLVSISDRRARLQRLARETNEDIVNALKPFPALFLLEAASGLGTVVLYLVHTESSTAYNALLATNGLHAVIVAVLYMWHPEHRILLRRVVEQWMGRRQPPPPAATAARASEQTCVARADAREDINNCAQSYSAIM